MAIAPVITFPTSQPGFSSNLQNQTLKGTAHPSTKDILVNGSTDNVSYVAGATGWVFTTMLHDGENAFQCMTDSFQVEQLNIRSTTGLYGKHTGFRQFTLHNLVELSSVE